ncbi:MAG: prepilin-type N-terminal cleavage/methylation domain-containing protein [Candidatus Nealsonbacteria bacterium]|nr:prepilin-type N-terminal cleavage/methylation domain-containing protein [Candidatus Nealsonbacteria bacterium]
MFEKGFTLLETLIAISIFSIIFGAVAAGIVFFYSSYGYALNQTLASSDARMSIARMEREIRSAAPSEDGAYILEKAADKELIFYSDIDGDGKTERVRYFLSTINSGTQSKECVVSSQGGSCHIIFSNFFTGTLKSAQAKVSLEGYFGQTTRYVDIQANNYSLGSICKTAGICTQCAGAWQGTTTYDVFSYAAGNSVDFYLDATSSVKKSCNWINPNHAFKAHVDFSWSEEVTGVGNEFKRGVIEPVGSPATYPLDSEKITMITPYVRNSPPIFSYYDASGNEITNIPARLVDTRLIKLFLTVDVDPNGSPNATEIETYIEPRNLRSLQ